MALNAPWFLILLYLLPLAWTGIHIWRWSGRFDLYRRELAWIIVSAILLGAGLALLGAAYLHDVWYC